MERNPKMSNVLRALLLILILSMPFYSHAQESVSAKAAVAIDASSDRILYAKNPNYKQPPASTAKLVTAMVALDKLSMEKIIKISENAANTPSVSPRIRPGEHFTAQNLLYMTLMRSVNSAAVALAEAVAGSEDAFAELMNKKAMELGAENTKFANASGLPGGEQYITAYDLAKIMKASLQYPQIKEIINTRAKHLASTEGRKVFLKNTNQLLWSDEGLLGGKTGYTKAAQHCFVCAAQKGESMIIVAVLGESVRDNLWHDTNILLSRGYDVLVGKEDPMVFFTNIQDRTMVLASYKPAPSQRIAKKESTYKKTKLRGKGSKGKIDTLKKSRTKPGKSSAVTKKTLEKSKQQNS